MGYLPQRALAAFLADSLRCSGVSLLALALPPFRPPKRPRATAAACLSTEDSGVASFTSDSDCPVASWTTLKAVTLKSWSRFVFLLDRLPIHKR